MSIEKQLATLQRKRDTAQTQCAERDGQLKRITKELKNTFGCSSIKESREKYEKMLKQAAVKRKKLEVGIAKMEEEMEE